MNPVAKIARLAGIAGLSVQSLYAGLISETPSMKDYQTGAEKLTVYTDVPGHNVSIINGYASRAKSDIYEIWVRSAATDGQWVQCFANMTYNRGLEMPRTPESFTGGSTHGYITDASGWTHTYANIEMSVDTPVEVEIRKIGSTPLNSSNVIFKSAVHPPHKVYDKQDVGGNVRFKLNNPCQVVIDINGQMDDHNANEPSNEPGGGMVGNPPVHAVAFYANPIIEKPVAGPTHRIVTVNTNQSTPTAYLTPPDPSTYDTLVFAPGVHNIGPGFNVHAGRNYYIPGDALLYGCIQNWNSSTPGYRCRGDRIKIYGYGTINVMQLPHKHSEDDPEYPEWFAWGASNFSGRTVGVYIGNALDFTPNGVTIADPGAFTTDISVQPDTNDDKSLISWIKMISWRVNGDGCGAAIDIEDSFFRTTDDCTYMNAARTRCTFWKDSNASIFKYNGNRAGWIIDCDVLYARWLGNRRPVFNFDRLTEGRPRYIDHKVLIKDVRFHDRLMNSTELIHMWGAENYKNLVFENISAFVSIGNRKSLIIGREGSAWYGNPIWKNFTFSSVTNGVTSTVVLNKDNFDKYFVRNEYVDFLLFDDPRDLTLTVNVNGQGSVTKTPDQATYKEVSTLTLTAVPGANNVFAGWDGVDAADVLKNPLTIRMLDHRTVTANFSPTFRITDRLTTPGTFDWVCPAGVTKVTAECWGGGGAGGSARAVTALSGGGAGGSYARKDVIVTPGTTYKNIVGAGGAYLTSVAASGLDPMQQGGASMFTSFNSSTTYCLAVGGAGGKNAVSSTQSGGLGSTTGCMGDVFFAGGSGTDGNHNSSGSGGGGGGGAGDSAPGGTGIGNAAGTGGVSGGGNGTGGRGTIATGAHAADASAPGGGGGGAKSASDGSVNHGGAGGSGRVVLTYFEDLDHFTVTAASPQTAGVPFDVTITAQDASNATVYRSLESLTVSSPDGNLMEFDWNGDGIYGDNSGLFVNGVKTLKARNKKAETVTIVATLENFTTPAPPSVTTTPGAFAKLQILAPGETAAPGTVTGTSGTPNSVGISIPFDVTVIAVDEFWNPVSGITDTVRITSSDPTATLPVDAPLADGTGTFVVRLNNVGRFTLTAADFTDGSRIPATSSALTVQGFTWVGDGLANRWTTTPSVLNWKDPLGVIVAFNNGNFAVFDDSSTNRVVDIEGTVQPSSILVDSSGNYTLGSTLGGSISGATGLLKEGAGTLTLASANSYNGNTAVNAGSLRAGHDSALGNSVVLLNATGTSLELADGTTINRSLTISNTGDKKSLALQAGATSAIYSGTITNNETTDGNFEVSVGEAGSLTLTRTVSANTLTKTGTGTLVLSGSTDNSWLLLDATEGGIHLGKDLVAGVRAVAGIRRIAGGATVKLTGAGTDQIFGGGSTGQGVNGIEAGGTLNLNGKSESISYLAGSNATLGNAGTGGVVDGGSGTVSLTVGEANVSSWFPGEIVNTSGTLNLVKVGTGTQTLTGASTYSGTTEIRSGTLTLTLADACLPPSTTVILGSGTNSGTLRLGSSNTLTPPFPGTASDQMLSGLQTSGTGTANAVIGGNSSVISTLTLHSSTNVVYGGKLGGADATANNLALTKIGAGTFTLTGTRTYIGPTIVEGGTLALVGGTHASPITVTSGASLGFTLGTPATSTAAVNLTAGTVKITGIVNNLSNYKLMTAASFAGQLVLSPAIPGYKLQLQGAGNTELWLVYSDPFTAWAGTGVMFNADTNNDGVNNGLAWFLGAGSPDENSAARLPKATRNGDALVLEFDCLNAADRGTAVFEVQYGQLDSWSGTVIPGAAGTFTDGVVDFIITDPEPDGGLLKVVATIPVSEAASGRVFGRIRGIQ